MLLPLLNEDFKISRSYTRLFVCVMWLTLGITGKASGQDKGCFSKDSNYFFHDIEMV